MVFPMIIDLVDTNTYRMKETEQVAMLVTLSRRGVEEDPSRVASKGLIAIDEHCVPLSLNLYSDH